MRWTQTESAISIETPAKLNLFLEVFGKRDDGFHELKTVITAVDLFDKLTISKADQPGIRLACRWAEELSAEANKVANELGDLPTDSSNLVFRAADLFLKTVGVHAGVKIDLEKLIPSQAGLGGASGNAAGTLLGLNELFETELSVNQLMEMAARLGSDIPFFIKSGYAICSGRGEKVTQINKDPALHFVLVKPPFGLPTGKVFSKLELGFDVKTIEAEQLLNNSVCWEKILFNRLQEAAEKVSPDIRKVCDFLNQSGCSASQMTGSGSCCFGLCRNQQDAQQIAQRISAQNIGFVFTCQNLTNFSVRE